MQAGSGENALDDFDDWMPRWEKKGQCEIAREKDEEESIGIMERTDLITS